jgi:glucosamine-6-phosphate deaminase
MEIYIAENKIISGKMAAEAAAEKLKQAVVNQGRATFVVATGTSQLDFLEALTSDKSIDWNRTTMFHLDEYIGIPDTHPASFCKYLRENLVEKVHPDIVHFINGEADDAHAECARLNHLISQHEIDVAFVGMGENGHLAFNDPPADFETRAPYIIVELDEACRNQQVGEGWFASLEDVPKQAISMSIQQIMKSKAIICIVPEKRKARAVRDCIEGHLTPEHPASILQKHVDTQVYLDEESASLLKKS